MKLFLWFLFAAAASATKPPDRILRGKWLEVTVGGGVFKVTDPHHESVPGAVGDGVTDDTKSIQAAFDKAAKAGGGTVLFPAGKTYFTLPFHFSGSHTAIELPLGARVVFSNDNSLYPGHNTSKILDLMTAQGTENKKDKLSNLAIIGGGVFDGQGKPWWPCAKLDKSNCFRPHMLNVEKNTDHFLIQGVTFKDSPNHNLKMGGYTELDHVTVLAPPGGSSTASTNGTKGPSHNTDAVDVHGTPFYVHDCHFDVGDDNVAVHASDVLVEDCYFGHGHGASIGSLGSGVQLRNITFRNIVFNRTGTAMRIKTDAGAKHSYVHDATWENFMLHDVEATVTLTMFYHSHTNETTDFDISNITIRNVTSYGTHNPDSGNPVTPGILHCQESAPCHKIRLEDIVHVDVSVRVCVCVCVCVG